VLLLGVSLWRVAVPDVVQDYFKYVLTAATLIGLLVVIRQLITWAQAPPSSAMPGCGGPPG